jgi:cell division protein FtsB
MATDIAVLIPIVAIAATAWVIVKMLHFRQGQRSSQGQGEAAENMRLARENEELKQVVGRLEERLQVLERIATDPAERTAREIEQLR